MQILFGDFRKFLCNFDRVSISMYETRNYQNYFSVSDVPADYDDYFVYGVGLIESEFECSLEQGHLAKVRTEVFTSGIEYLPCIEIMLSKEPREF